MEFSRQECWSGLPFPSPGDFSDSGIEPGSPALQADSLSSEPPQKPCCSNGFLLLSSERNQNGKQTNYSISHFALDTTYLIQLYPRSNLIM